MLEWSDWYGSKIGMIGEDIPIRNIRRRLNGLRDKEDPKALAYGLYKYHAECNLKVDRKMVATCHTKTLS